MRVFFSVGEPSGDQHAAHLISEWRRRGHHIEACGYGGPQMQAAGCRLHFELTTLAVMGIVKVLPLIFQFLALVKQAERYFRDERPDAVVLVDFPGFNWWIARKAKKYGIPVYYYLPPQLWAWAPWRVRRVQRYVEHVYSGLNFETDWYRRHNVNVTFVGHPFFDEVAEHELDAAFLLSQKSLPGRIVAILPGSRNEEVHRNFPLMVEAARRLQAEFPDIRFLVANYKASQREWCRGHLDEAGRGLPFELHVGRTSEIIDVAECVLMVSGSVSLEILARKTPAVVQYRCGWVMYAVGRSLVTCRHLSLPNLMVDRPLLPEVLSVGNPQKAIDQVVSHLRDWLAHPERLQAVRDDLTRLGEQVIQTGASQRVATDLLARLEQKAAEVTPAARKAG